ncbi:uncharacterized protein [Antedon mediterranea]|uniref:uncharacterized protein n=1 Tax=Antedon mediterranea TaxID=105859 RepID=UPI003AF4A958
MGLNYNFSRTNVSAFKRKRGRRAGRNMRKQILVQIGGRVDNSNINGERGPSILVPILCKAKLSRSNIYPSVFLCNARSLCNKMNEFELVLANSNIDIAGITESWFHSDFSSECSAVQGFSCIRNDRSNRVGGGVVLYINEVYDYEVDDACPIDLECLCVDVKINLSFSIVTIVVYYPPNCNRNQQLTEFLCSRIDYFRSVRDNAAFIIMGDFNDYDIDPLLYQTSLEQVVDFPTRDDACLDKMLTNISDLYQSPLKLSPLGCSDHASILLKPNFIQKKPVKRRLLVRRPLKDSSMRAFGQVITGIDWDDIVHEDDSSEYLAAKFESVLKETYEKSFPSVVIRVRDNDKPWFNQSIKKMIEKRHRAYRKGNQTRYRHFRRLVRSEVRLAKSNFYKESISSLRKIEPQKWHKKVQRIAGKSKPQSALLEPGCDPDVVVDVVNKHFARICSFLPALDLRNLPAFLPSVKPPVIFPGQVFKLLKGINVNKSRHPRDIPLRLIKEFALELAQPLAKILNCCLQDNNFPSIWKNAIITPVPKKPKASTPNEHRPISITPVFGRIFESFLSDWIATDFRPLMDSQQFGNAKGSSPTHYLVQLCNRLLSGLDSSGMYGTICAIDFSKAFDRVNHSILIDKLIGLNIMPSIIPTVCSFLSQRNQCVRLGGSVSAPEPISCGVPQGTKLGPILFTIMVNDLLNNVPDRWKFVDDLTIGEVISVQRPEDSSIQSNLDALSSWCVENDATPNPVKFQVMRVHFLRNFPQFEPLQMDGVILEESQSVKLLGVHLQCDLKWDKQIKEVVSRASRRLYMLYILKRFGAPNDDLVFTFITYIRPLLEYASPLWHSSITNKQSDQLEFIQKRVVKLIIGYQNYVSYAKSLETLKLKTLQHRRQVLLYNFGKGLLKSDRFKEWIPEKEKPTRCLRKVISLMCHDVGLKDLLHQQFQLLLDS